jgi:hypothetical protein
MHIQFVDEGDPVERAQARKAVYWRAIRRQRWIQVQSYALIAVGSVASVWCESAFSGESSSSWLPLYLVWVPIGVAGLLSMALERRSRPPASPLPRMLVEITEVEATFTTTNSRTSFPWSVVTRTEERDGVFIVRRGEREDRHFAFAIDRLTSDQAAELREFVSTIRAPLVAP